LPCRYSPAYFCTTLMASFEMASEKILQFTGKSKDSLTSGQQMGVNLTGGLIAGMAAAVISQPADTLLSKINKSKGAPGQSTTSRLVQMSGQLGVKGLFTGMSARLVMIGTLTAGQCRSPWLLGCWMVADKQSLSMETSRRPSTPPAVSRLPLSPSKRPVSLPYRFCGCIFTSKSSLAEFVATAITARDRV
jgi:hypothetical protein